MHEIKEFIRKIGKDNIVQCTLCPHNCLIADNKKGLCGTRINHGGRFYSMVYGRPSAIQLDPVEKKPLYHFYPGTQILSIGTLGCNLFCKGCQNYEISKGPIVELPYVEPEHIIEQAEDNDVNMIAYTYNEPTIFYEYMIDIAKIARRKKIKNVVVSNGFINNAPLKKLLKYIDAANIDLKGFNENFYKEYANAKLEPVLKTLKTIKKSEKWLEVTNLIIPGLNDKESETEEMCRWIGKNLKHTPLHFSRFFPYYKAIENDITPEKTLFKAKKIAMDNGIEYVYIGNIGKLENTYCHNCGNLIIMRNEKVKVLGITDGKCIYCRKKIPGIFN